MTASQRATPAAYDIRAEQPGDSAAIDALVRAAFGQDEEMLLVRSLRDGGFNLLSLVAVRGKEIAGHLLFTRLLIEGVDQTWNAVALAPIAVSPDRQRSGIGSQLMRTGLLQLKDRGESIVVVLGHEHYYPRFGFSAQLAESLISPFPGPHWMALELLPGALKDVRGQVKYVPPFGIA
ncbi:GNAT family N-acetyltransferase [Anatilimnocola floriformis]|uniref:GNAT family N-acetyltransferase n=1 Tax=Anatilimnocola floriformis TaxID=2948575 RepID=UPI0020C48739|nr:N-acetyltransferase [Anatilimnocola floriformis]